MTRVKHYRLRIGLRRRLVQNWVQVGREPDLLSRGFERGERKGSAAKEGGRRCGKVRVFGADIENTDECCSAGIAVPVLQT